MSVKIERNFGMTDEAWRAWLEKHGDDPQGCTVCGAIAGTCADFPLCPGNPLWKEGPVEMADDPAQFTKEKIEELEAVFDLRWKASQRAIKRWQQAHPGNDLVWPDHADLCVWLMEELDKRTAERSQDERCLRRMLAHAYAGEHLYGDDGELQDGRLPFPIDFVRDSVQQIERKIHERGMYQLANATCPECSQIVPVFGHDNACSRVTPTAPETRASLAELLASERRYATQLRGHGDHEGADIIDALCDRWDGDRPWNNAVETPEDHCKHGALLGSPCKQCGGTAYLITVSHAEKTDAPPPQSNP